MKLHITAKPRASKNLVKKIDEENFEVWVTAPPVKGLANLAIAELLAEHFGVAKYNVKLVSGFSSKEKIFEILEGQ